MAETEIGQGLPVIVEARYLRDLARKILDWDVDMVRAGRAQEAFNRTSTFHALIRICDALEVMTPISCHQCGLSVAVIRAGGTFAFCQSCKDSLDRDIKIPHKGL
jgi:hypothetical protein